MILQDTSGLYSMSFDARNFYTNYADLSVKDKINNQMKTIRKVQNTCVMLNYYNKMEQDNYLGYELEVFKNGEGTDIQYIFHQYKKYKIT